MKIRPVILSAVVFVGITSASYAAAISYPNLTSFDSALSAAGLIGTTYGFGGGPTPVSDPAGFTFGPASLAGHNPGNGASFIKSDIYGISGAFFSHQLFSQSTGNTVQITFDAPVRAFAFDSNTWNFGIGDPNNPNNWPSSGITGLTLTTSLGDVLSLSTPAYAGSAAPIGFNGIISDAAFSSVTLSILEGQHFQISGFTTAPVPEPSSWLLALAASGGTLARRRRIASRVSKRNSE